MFRIKIIIFVLAISKAAYSDICIEEKITTTISGRMFHGTRKTCITKDKALLADPTLSRRAIFDYNNNKVYLIDDAKRDISVSPLNNFKLPVNENIYSGFLSLKESDLRSKESGNKRKIGKYDCFEIVIYVPKIAALSRIWLSRGIEAPLNSYFSFLEKNSDILLKKIIPRMKESNAFVVESTTTLVRPKEPERYLKIELINISTQDVPDNLFVLPEDYRKINLE